MKNLLVATLVWALGASAFAQKANTRAGQEGGGGSGVEVDVVSSAFEVYLWIRENPGVIPVTADEFYSVFDPKIVKPTDDILKYRGKEVDAFYCENVSTQCPEVDIIRVNRNGWRNNNQEISLKWKTASHEFFRRLRAKGNVKAEDDGYELSRAIVAKKFGDPGFLRFILKEVIQGKNFDPYPRQLICSWHMEVNLLSSPYQLVATMIDGPQIGCGETSTYVLDCDPVTLTCSTDKYLSRGERDRFVVSLMQDGNILGTVSDLPNTTSRTVKYIPRR